MGAVKGATCPEFPNHLIDWLNWSQLASNPYHDPRLYQLAAVSHSLLSTVQDRILSINLKVFALFFFQCKKSPSLGEPNG